MNALPSIKVPVSVHGGPELSVIIPTFSELENVREVVRRLDACLTGLLWEVIFVDDNSPDGTAQAVRQMGQCDHRVRVVHRIGRRGLATACVEGMLASSAPYLAVMDADLQHDERLLPEMLSTLEKEEVEIVVGSRYVAGGSTGSWDANRRSLSRLATRMSRLVLKADLKDPMSGFFLLRRELLHEVVSNLSGLGFKILLDIFTSAGRPVKFRELPYMFGRRQAGESKLDSTATWDYLMLLLDKAVGRYVPVRFVPFALVGGFGVFIHMAVLSLGFHFAMLSFVTSQTIATLMAMTANFFVNNALTYRDRRLKGWGLLKGWLSFTIACSLGAASNVGIATYLFEGHTVGWVWSAAAGVIVGAVWNYAVTSVYTWRAPTAAVHRGMG